MAGRSVQGWTACYHLSGPRSYRDLASRLLRRVTRGGVRMISFVIGLMIGSAFGVCLMGALWAREREERLREFIAVTTLPPRARSRAPVPRRSFG